MEFLSSVSGSLLELGGPDWNPDEGKVVVLLLIVVVVLGVIVVEVVEIVVEVVVVVVVLVVVEVLVVEVCHMSAQSVSHVRTWLS